MKENLYMIVFIIISSCKILNSKSYEYLSVIHPNCDILDGADICYVKTFQATCIDNLYYINWIAISNSEKFIYSVEKSFDGKHFKQIYFKKGSISPTNEVALLSCIKDTNLTNVCVFYRLKALPLNTNLNILNKSKANQLNDLMTIKVYKDKRTSSAFSLRDEG